MKTVIHLTAVIMRDGKSWSKSTVLHQEVEGDVNLTIEMTKKCSLPDGPNLLESFIGEDGKFGEWDDSFDPNRLGPPIED